MSAKKRIAHDTDHVLDAVSRAVREAIAHGIPIHSPTGMRSELLQLVRQGLAGEGSKERA